MNPTVFFQKNLLIQILLFGCLAAIISVASIWSLQNHWLLEHQQENLALARSIAVSITTFPVSQKQLEEFLKIPKIAYIIIQNQHHLLQVYRPSFRELIQHYEQTELTQEIRQLDFAGQVIEEVSLLVATQPPKDLHVGFLQVEPSVIKPMVTTFLLLLGSGIIIHFLMLKSTFRSFQKLIALVENQLSLRKSEVLGQSIDSMVQEVRHYAYGLQQSEERFQKTTEIIPLPIIISRLADGLVLYANTKATDAFGLTSLPGHYLAELDGNQGEMAKWLAQVQHQKQIFDYALQFRKADNTCLWFKSFTQTIVFKEEESIISVFYDFTEQQKTEVERYHFTRQLQESEERFRVIAETTPVPIIIHRIHDDMIVYANEQASVTFGLSSAFQLVSKKIQELYLNETEWQQIREFIKKDEFIYDYEVQMKKYDNTPFWVNLFSQPTIFNNAPVMINTIHDISEHKWIEEERTRYIEDLGSLNAMLTELNVAYDRFVPYEFLQILEKENAIEVKLGDHVEKEMTILFSDIRGFTSLSEKMTPPENFNFINEYLSLMEPLISQHNGFIDKYIGDAIMALFPLQVDDAVQSAVAMLMALANYNQRRQQHNLSCIDIGIGLNSGVLMLGTVGGKNRMDGTVIGDAVNLASRIEGLTKNYGTPLLITEHTYQKITDVSRYQIRIIDRVKVKGKSTLVTLYEVFDAQPPAMVELKLATLDDFEQGVKYYHQGYLDEALANFKQVLKLNPHDKAAQSYLQRCNSMPVLNYRD